MVNGDVFAMDFAKEEQFFQVTPPGPCRTIRSLGCRPAATNRNDTPRTPKQ